MKPTTIFSLAALAALALVAPAAQAQQTLYVANSGGSRNPNTIETIDSSGNGTTFASGLSNPAGLAFDPSGDLFVTNLVNSTVVKYTNTNGTLSSTGTTFATSASGLGSPRGLAFDPSGNLFVANSTGSTGNYKILEYTPNGTASTFTLGAQTGTVGLAFDSAGNLYAVSNNDRITKFAYSNGSLSSTGTIFASGNVSTDAFAGIAFDSTGDLFLTNGGTTNNPSIEEFVFSGGALSSTPTVFDNTVYNSGSTHGLKGPQNIAFDSAGNMYVSNNGLYSTIQKYAFTGGSLSHTSTTFVDGTSTGAGYSQINSPLGLAFAPAVAAAPEPSQAVALLIGALSLGVLALRAKRRTA